MNLFPFQKSLVDFAKKKSRAAIFADCGLGKTPMQLAWAQSVVEKSNGRVLILTPLAVGAQTVREGEKFGIECHRSRDGGLNGGRIIVTNYEQLHRFNPSDFVGLVADESGILKNCHGKTRNDVVEFASRIENRLLCSATPSPNDYTELGNSVAALGIMRMVEMLAKYFIHDSGDTGNWRLKGHAQDPFWKFVASWARAVRHPRDIGFDQPGYDLPPLKTELHILKSRPIDGFLFPSEAVTLDEQRSERRDTIEARCSKVAEIANSNNRQFIAWCSLNDESELLTEYINGAVELSGSDSDEEKEEKVIGFSTGQIRALVTKPKICSHGVNWQSCNAMSFFPSHSHEQFYQAVRRCWRFGQKNPVTVHIVTTEAESLVLENLRRKERDSDEMFTRIVKNMSDFYFNDEVKYKPTKQITIPSWLKS
jgi:superfamily II DNA or RNA helicase